MLATYLRSSSYGAYDWCEHRFYLEYSLGMKAPSGKKADVGSVVHKALEMLARWKLATQRGEVEFRDEEMDILYQTKDVHADLVLNDAFRHYSGKNAHHTWTDDDREECRALMWETLNLNDGLYDPRLREIVAPEQYFDLEIPEPWAWYDVKDPHSGARVQGRYAVKGTMDLLTRIDNQTLELIDWKTGKRLNWATGEEKSYEKLAKDDFQLLLYFYALTRLYPDVRYIFITIFYVRAGEPFTIPFDRLYDVPRALEMMRKRFEEIKHNYWPKRIIGDAEHNWKCFRLCHFHKTKQEGTDLSICKFMHQQIQQLGMDRVTAKYGKPGVWAKYADGGGQSNRET